MIYTSYLHTRDKIDQELKNKKEKMRTDIIMIIGIHTLAYNEHVWSKQIDSYTFFLIIGHTHTHTHTRTHLRARTKREKCMYKIDHI